MANQDKEKTLDMAMSQIQKQFGKGAIMRLGDKAIPSKISTISTGSLSLDIAIGIGGIPRGRITEIYGPESSGKTTLALHCIAEAQKSGGNAAFIDAEHALDINYAKNLGVNINDLLVSQPGSGEEALEITETLVRSNAIDMIIIDSVAALTPKSEIEGNMGDSQMGVQARLMSQALRKLTGAVSKSNIAVVFINQIRMKIGVVFGNPETTSGGRALKFYTSLRLEIRRVTSIKDGSDVLGNRTRVKVVKNKVAPPFKKTEFDIMYGKGISYTGDVLDLAVTLDIVDKSGSWYSYEKERIGQGRENTKTFLDENKDILNEIANEVQSALGLEVSEKKKKNRDDTKEKK